MIQIDRRGEGIKKKVGRRVRNMFMYGIVFIFVVAADLATKHLATKTFLISEEPTNPRRYESSSENVFLLGSESNWLRFDVTYLRNPGAAWGFLADAPEGPKLAFFHVVTLIASIGVLLVFRGSHPTQFVTRAGLVLILGGAWGNGLDRLFRSYVVDWIHFSWDVPFWAYSFPVFNAADIAINIGMALMLLDAILAEVRTRAPVRNLNSFQS